MRTFSIQHGAVPLCTWDLETSQVSLHPQVAQNEGVLVLPESRAVGFVLDPSGIGVECRISIGDVALADISPVPIDATGAQMGGRRFWRDFVYFDSARGPTQLILEARPEGAEAFPWVTLLSTTIYVEPTKLGETRYLAMSSDLDRASHSLLVDLYGKSRRSVDVRYSREARESHSREAELRAIEATLRQVEGLLLSIAQRPASKVVAVRTHQQYWGAERLDQAAIVAFARRSTDVRRAPRPIPVISRTRTESFDVPEHRFIKAFLKLLQRRCEYCSAAASAHIESINAERHWRDIPRGDAPTLFEVVDMPRIGNLHRAEASARASRAMALAMQRLSFLREVPAEVNAPRGGMFQRNQDYQALFQVMRRFLIRNAVWFEGESYASITKLTWRLFEQWTYLSVVDAFRAAGVDLQGWSEVLSQNLRSRFTIDFDRGLMFEGALGRDLKLRFRYEPWILGQSAAVSAGETLHRGSASKAPWCPDIAIECLRRDGGKWESVYAIVLDCKYTTKVTAQHWSEITKYLEIRSTTTGRQVVKQLWLVSLTEVAHVSCEDPLVEFTTRGPTCGVDEAVRFRLGVAPGSMEAESGHQGFGGAFRLFAEGTNAFLRRHFSSTAPGAEG